MNYHEDRMLYENIVFIGYFYKAYHISILRSISILVKFTNGIELFILCTNKKMFTKGSFMYANNVKIFKQWLIISTLFFGSIMMAGCDNSERDYLSLHNNSLVVDLHSDTPLRMKDGFDFSVRDTSGHMDIPRLKEGGINLQVFACFVSTDTPLEECRPIVDELIDSLEVHINHNSDQIAICRNASEAEAIINENKIAAFIGIENGVAINNSLDNLQHFYDRGVRYLTLTHSSSNDWCISSGDTLPAFNGLTDFGRDVVRKMNELGMIVDISHSSVSAFDEVLKITTAPVIASHSCVHSICPHNRNLTDEQIKAIAANGGMIGINFFDGYLSPDNEWFKIGDSLGNVYHELIDSAHEMYPNDYNKRNEMLKPVWDIMKIETEKLGINIKTIVDHIDYIVKLVGADYVGFGSDFDGVGSLPEGLDDCSMLPNITKELVMRGYSDKDIRKILGENFIRIFREVCK